MDNLPLRLQESAATLTVSDIEKFADGWFLSCEISQHSEATLSNRRLIVKNLLWFLKKKKHTACGRAGSMARARALMRIVGCDLMLYCNEMQTASKSREKKAKQKPKAKKKGTVS